MRNRFAAAFRYLMGRSQVVRQRILIPPFPGSNPGAPAPNSTLVILVPKTRGKARTFGRFFYITQYGDADYWASPLQTLGSGTGDCEDYAILKYVALRAVGVDAANLRLVIVQDDKRRTQHAVVAVRYEQHWLILDNLTMAIVTAEDARNYRPLFALNSRAVAVAAVDPARATKIE